LNWSKYSCNSLSVVPKLPNWIYSHYCIFLIGYTHVIVSTNTTKTILLSQKLIP